MRRRRCRDAGKAWRRRRKEDETSQARWITGQVIYADGGATRMNAGVPPEIQLG